MQLDRIRPSHRMRAEILALEPGRGAAITEPQHELAMHPHSPAVAANEAHDIDVLLVAGERHEVDQSHRAFIGLEGRLEDCCARPVAAGDGRLPACRRDAPEAVLGRAEQSREAGVGIEPWQAEPVDRAIARDQCAGQHRSEEDTSEPQSLMRTSYAVYCLKTKTEDK